MHACLSLFSIFYLLSSSLIVSLLTILSCHHSVLWNFARPKSKTTTCNNINYNHNHITQPVTTTITTNTMSSTDLPRADVSKANEQKRNDKTLLSKWFLLKVKGTVKVVTIEATADDIGNFFTKVCDKLGVEEEGATLLYPMRTTSGSHCEISIEKDEFVIESLTTFFLSCEEGSQLVVVPPKKEEKKGRDYRTTEYGFNTIIKKKFVVDR